MAMVTISESTAQTLVRKNLDEQGINVSTILGDSDSSDLDAIINKTLPEAINAVHESVPAYMLEGEDLKSHLEGVSIKSCVLRFKCLASFSGFLRLVSFKATDSDYVIDTPTAEDTPVGRLQLNTYLRGTTERPVLVQEQGSPSSPAFRYYSLASGTADEEPPTDEGGEDTIIDKISVMTYIPRATYAAGSTYSYSSNLLQNIIDQLTGMVLAIYNDYNKAQYFFNRAGVAQTVPNNQ